MNTNPKRHNRNVARELETTSRAVLAKGAYLCEAINALRWERRAGGAGD
jgi:hypothetical protein